MNSEMQTYEFPIGDATGLAALIARLLLPRGLGTQPSVRVDRSDRRPCSGSAGAFLANNNFLDNQHPRRRLLYSHNSRFDWRLCQHLLSFHWLRPFPGRGLARALAGPADLRFRLRCRPFCDRSALDVRLDALRGLFAPRLLRFGHSYLLKLAYANVLSIPYRDSP